MTEKRRIVSIDVARGIAMIAIILGHLGNRRINSIVTTFHVPVFFFISGLFFHTEINPVDFIKKKTKGLLLPYFLTSILLCAFSIPLGILQGLDWKKEAIKWIIASLYGAGFDIEGFTVAPSIGAIWFLLALFWSELLFFFISRLPNGFRLCSVLCIFTLSVWSAKYIWLPLSIQAGGSGLLFLYAGYLTGDAREQIVRLITNKKELATACFVFLVLIWMYCIQKNEGIYLSQARFENGILDILGCMTGIAVVLYLSMHIETNTKGVAKVLAFVGCNSLYVLGVHLLENNLIPWLDLFTLASRRFGLPENGFVAFVLLGKMLVICPLVWGLTKMVNWIKTKEH